MDLDNFKIFMVYSDEAVTTIKDFILGYSNKEDDIGYVRIDYNMAKDGSISDSNRTIVVMKEYIFLKLQKEGFSDRNGTNMLRIVPFRFHRGFFPKGNNRSLHVNLPLDQISFESCKSQLESMMDMVVNLGFLERSNYSISYPLKSRESKEDGYLGYSVIAFQNNIPQKAYIAPRIILGQFRWDLGNEKTIVTKISWSSIRHQSVFSRTKFRRKRKEVLQPAEEEKN